MPTASDPKWSRRVSARGRLVPPPTRPQSGLPGGPPFELAQKVYLTRFQVFPGYATEIAQAQRNVWQPFGTRGVKPITLPRIW